MIMIMIMQITMTRIDKVSSPVATLASIYNWAGLNFSSTVTRYVDPRPENRQIVSQIFPWRGLGNEATMEEYIKMLLPPDSTRPHTGRHNNFSALPKQVLQEIEDSCGKVLEKLGFSKVLQR